MTKSMKPKIKSVEAYGIVSNGKLIREAYRSKNQAMEYGGKRREIIPVLITPIKKK